MASHRFVIERDRLLTDMAKKDDRLAELEAEMERPESERLMKAYGTEIARLLEEAETTANRLRTAVDNEARSRTEDARREAEEVRTSPLNANPSSTTSFNGSTMRFRRLNFAVPPLCWALQGSRNQGSRN